MNKLLIITLVFVFPSFPSLSEKDKFDYDQHKRKLIEKNFC